MAQIKELVEGLEILAKTAKVPVGLAENGETDTRTAHVGGAGHDVLWGPECEPSADDIKRLEALGWHLCSETGLWSIFV